MKSLIVGLLVLSASLAEANSKSQVVQKFLDLANKSDSAIAQTLDKVRKEKVNGFLPEEDQVIPLKLSAQNLSLLKLESESYTGKLISDDEREPGYLNEKYLVSITANEVYYGGRINLETAVLFECTYAKVQTDKNPTIDCYAK